MAQLIATTGIDVLSGGSTDDTFVFSTGQVVQAGDVFNGGGGTDTLSIAGGDAFIYNFGLATLVSIEALTFSNGALISFKASQFGAGGISNTLHVITSSGRDGITVELESPGLFSAAGWTFNFVVASQGDFLQIFGTDGADTIASWQGFSVLRGGAGDDTLSSGPSADTLDGGAGADAMTGGSGPDTYVIDNAGDTIIELDESGIDTLDLRIGAYAIPDNVENAFLREGFGFTTLDATGNALGNRLTGGLGDDVLRGLDGNDTLDGMGGEDTLIGGQGDDIFVVYSPTAVVTELLNQGNDTVRTALTSVSLTGYANVENLIYIGSSSFVGQGDAGANILEGAAGNDYFYANAGDDTARGNAGADVFVMAEGNDVVFGGDATDYAYGDAGNDTLHGEGGVDVLLGGEGADTMFGGVEGDFFYGENGDDVAFGEDGNDIFVMAAGNDTASGGAGQDYFYTGDGNDTLNGGDGVDVMLGEAGNDVFNPGLAVDYVFMGTGSDTLNVDRTLSGVTVLNDFTPGNASADRINLTGTGWNSFAQVQANVFDYTASGGFCVIALDGDTSIWLIGVQPGQLTAGDFIFGGG